MYGGQYPKPATELYTYNFIVDGLVVNDANNIFLQRDGTRYLSVLLVPVILQQTIWTNKHGNLRKVWYDSPVIGNCLYSLRL
jgi:enterochelin esterase family protein